MAARGYTVVVQDHRGRYASDGEYAWMFRDWTETHDAEDGYDSVEWAAKLPWSDGRVGTWGHSNASWAIWLMFSTQPPSLTAGLSSGMCENLLDLNFGIFETGRRLEWTHMMGADMRLKAGDKDGPLTPAEANRRWAEVERGKYIWWLPLGDIPGQLFSTLNEQLQTYHRAQNVEFMRFGEFHSKVNVPTLQITGWWDRLIGTVDNFEGLTKRGAEELRDQHRLIIGPWGHDPTDFSCKIGPVDYGPEADRKYHSMITRWYDYQFKGYANGIEEEDPIQMFVLGENVWRGEKEWPLARTQFTPFYLHSEGSANTVFGNGSLSIDTPSSSEAESDEYDYDPRDPVMSLMRADSQAAPVDQSPHDHRQDVLFYETPVLQEELELTGPVRLKLWAKTDGPDTDWAARLAIVFEDGLAMNLTYGIMRAQYREGYENPKLLEPGETYEYDVKLNPVGVLLKPGQKLRLYVASSDFPNFDRNHNTGTPYWEDEELRVAHQTVFHSADKPSHLILPVIPR
jgi:putative CocE/NonD family hydrolase